MSFFAIVSILLSANLGSDAFFSAKAKLARATEHFESLNREMLGYSEQNPIDIVPGHNADCTEHFLSLKVAEEPPLVRWGILTGDIVHNLRSALDHAVYGLVVRRTGKNPPDRWGELGFPVCTHPDRFTSALGKLGQLRKDRVVRAQFESLQPYALVRDNGPPALQFLQDIDNADKHRLVSVVMAVTDTLNMKIYGLPPGAEVVSRILTKTALRNGAKVLLLTVDRPSPNVQMQGAVSLFPAISYAGSAWPLDSALTFLHSAVSHALSTIEALGK